MPDDDANTDENGSEPEDDGSILDGGEEHEGPSPGTIAPPD